MPRARFAKAVKPRPPQAPDRASVREALWFDVKTAETPGEHPARRSQGSLRSTTPALLLGPAHLVIGEPPAWRHYPEVATLASLSNPLIPLILLLMLDGIAALCAALAAQA